MPERFVERGWIDRRDDYFLIHLDEVKRVIDDPSLGSGLRAIAKRRAAELEAERDLQMPLFMRESELRVARSAGATPVGCRARDVERERSQGLCASARAQSRPKSS